MASILKFFKSGRRIDALNKKISALEAANKQLRRDAKKMETRLTATMDLLGALYANDSKVDFSANTPQERAWFGRHGFRYIIHHMGEDWENTRIPFWQQTLGILQDIGSICEFGANIGANLKAIRHLNPDIEIGCIEVNPVACKILKEDGFSAVVGSIANVDLGRKFDLVFSRGVLIHVKPSDLEAVMKNMAEHSARYVMIYEHYSDAMHSLEGYGDTVTKTMGEQSEGFQFWGDFSGAFSKLFPEWTVVNFGVNTNVRQAPKHGDLHWTIFQRPGT